MLNAWREHEEEEALAKARPPESKERIVDQSKGFRSTKCMCA